MTARRLTLTIGGHHLSAFTSWGDLDWSLCWPGYSDELTFTVRSHTHILTTGAPVTLACCGVPLWSGTLAKPTRGQPLRAGGLHRLAGEYAALNEGGDVSVYADEATDVAIDRGLPWVKRISLGGGAQPLKTDAPVKVSDVLTSASEQLAGDQAWGILPNKELTRRSRPPARFHLRPDSVDLGIATDNYGSTIIARYLDSTTSTYETAIRVNPGAAERWGYKELTLPKALNDGAAMTLVEAASVLETIASRGRARPGWTDAIEIPYGVLLNDRQQPVDLYGIRPWDTVRAHGIDGRVADLAGQTWVELPAARIMHSDSKPDVVTIAPVGLVDPMGDIIKEMTAA